MKFHKIILALAALIIIFNEAESQLAQPTRTDPFFPPITPTPPPPTTTPPTTTPTPIPPPTSPKTTSTPPIKSPSTSSAPLTSSALPSVSPSSPSVPPPSLPPISNSPAPSSKSPASSPSTSSSPFDCSVLRSCSDPKTYCDIPAGKCRSKKNLGDQCNNDDNECQPPFVCRENTCGYSDVATANARSRSGSDYNVKRVAIFGAIIVGACGICGLIFFVIRYLKKKRDYDIASRLYSTDDDMSETDPYPFAERSNSFSQNTVQPPRAPTTNRYDNLPPTGNRGFMPRPGYQNYYNKYGNEGMYMRQNMQNMPNEERTMNLLQQTRGNVMVTPQQNYNWNPQAMRMNQGGLFPIPAVSVAPPQNNMNNVVPPANNMNNTRNLNNFNSPGEDDESKHDHLVKTLRYSVDYTNDHNHNHHQANSRNVVRRDSNTLSSDDVKSGPELKSDGKKETKSRSNKASKVSKEKKETHSTYDPSFLDTYARESIFTKTLETKLSQSSMKYNKNKDDPKTSTIQQSISRSQIVNDI